MKTQHLKAALSLTGFTAIGVTLACLGAFRVIPDPFWASALCSAVIVPAIVYLAKLWNRNYYLRKTLDAYEAAGLSVVGAEMYVTRDMKAILRTEPVLCAALIYYAHVQRFAAFMMCDQAAPALRDQGFTAAAGEWTVALVEVLLPHLELAHPEDAIDHGLHTKVAAGTQAVADVKHPTPMLSLDKAKTMDEVHALLARAEEAAEAIGVPKSHIMLHVEPKLDGMAMRAVYRNGRLVQVVTRGDGRAGEDVTARLARPQVAVRGLPTFIDNAPAVLELRGEMLMSHADFEFSNANRVAAGKTAFANPRNATAGSVRAETLDYDVRLTFICYVDTFGDASLLDAAHLDGSLQGWDYESNIKRFGEYRDRFDYPTDGVVIKVNNPDVRRRMGEGSRAPKWALAYKYEAEKGKTVLRDIEMGVGRTGNISFTAILDPVKVDGSVVARATLHNFGFIAENDLRIGDTVEVYKANDIIPRVVKPFVELRPATAIPYDPPRVCPVSGEPLDTSGKIWRSLAPEASLGSAIAYAASRDALDIDGLGTEIAVALVENDLVADIGDLFSLTVPQLTSLQLAQPDGSVRLLGEKVAKKLVENIAKAKERPLARFITALGIRKSGRTFGRRIASEFETIDAVLAATRDDFFRVEGVGEERATLFFEGFQRNRPVIEKLLAAGVPLNTVATAPDGASGARPLEGMRVVVSGGMSGVLSKYSRNEMNELVERYGGKSSGSVSKTTSLLVAGEGAGSKLAKAEELGVKVMTPEEFAELVGE